jgi:hypothetical protein
MPLDRGEFRVQRVECRILGSVHERMLAAKDENGLPDDGRQTTREDVKPEAWRVETSQRSNVQTFQRSNEPT